MPKRLLADDKQFVDAAIAAASTPRAPAAGGRGLLLGAPGKRARRLMDEHGSLTSAGAYFYETTRGRAPDRGFDYTQAPMRNGARVQVKLLDGSVGTVRTWDGVQRR